MVKYRIGIYFMFPIQMCKGESEMNKYGQANTSDFILKMKTKTGSFKIKNYLFFSQNKIF